MIRKNIFYNRNLLRIIVIGNGNGDFGWFGKVDGKYLRLGNIFGNNRLSNNEVVLSIIDNWV